MKKWIKVSYTNLNGNSMEGYIKNEGLEPGSKTEYWNRQLYRKTDDGEYVPLLVDRFPVWVPPTMLIREDGKPVKTYKEETISQTSRQ